jgi:hypothetical protein
MASSLYIEDTFIQFYDNCISLLQDKDMTACHSFYELVILNKPLTASQGNFLLKILEKYKHLGIRSGVEHADNLSALVWKNPFRTLDMSRSVFVESTDSGISVCMKFPYALKKEFETDIENNKVDSASRWDHDRKLRVLSAYQHNLIQIHEFCQKHNFEIDNSFLDAVSQVEEIWQSQDKVLCHSVIEDNNVVLKNAVGSSVDYWNDRKSSSINHNMYLAKTMGFPLRLPFAAETTVEQIAVSKEKSFWMPSVDNFFELYRDIGGIAGVLLDRNTKNVIEWLDNFAKTAEKHSMRHLIRVCFRDESDKNSQLNAWIKDNDLGGKVDEGKILIFLHKPPKWLFKKNVDVNIIVTNSYTPHNEPISTAWLSSHPCVCYVGEIKPTPPRNTKIVSL